MGAALVKHCFCSADSDVSDARYNNRHKSRTTSSSSSTSSIDDAAAAALLARRTQQLRQLERQIQQLTKQHSNSNSTSHNSSRHRRGSSRATLIAPPPPPPTAGSVSAPLNTPLSMTSSYSTTMSESSFGGALSCGDAMVTAQPQDDEILDMVMANAGLAFHPTQQWRTSQQPTVYYQQPSTLAGSLPAMRPAPMTRRGSSNQSFRTLLPDTYMLQEVLGTGTTSTCYRVERRVDGAAFACKVIDKRRLAVSTTQRDGIAFQLRREVDVLERVDHPNIAKLEAAFENDSYLILVMELLDGGELFDAIVERGRFAERDAIDVARAVLSAMQYMHALGVVHRDLKPENMLLATARRCNCKSNQMATDTDCNCNDKKLVVKIIDFGFAKFMAGEHATTTSFLGTGGYLAPEILLHHPYTSAVDMWAFGVLLYLLLCGRLPFAASTHLRPNQKITSLYRLTFPPKYWADVSSEARDLVQRILVLNPRKRLTAKDALRHVWLQ